MTLVTLLMLGGGLIFTLWAIGVPLAFWRQGQPEVNPYLGRIPINVRPIAAHTKVDRTDLLDPKTGWLKYQELPPRTVIGMSISGVNSQGVLALGKIADVRQHEGQLVFVLDSGEEIPQSQTNELGGALMPVYEVALAVHPGDAIPLQSALNKELEVICVAHSMQFSPESDSPVSRQPAGPGAPVTSRSILAYEVLSHDYFEDAATRRIRHESVTTDEIERLGVVTSLDQLMGAVVKHDIPKRSFITQADLLQAPRIEPRRTVEPVEAKLNEAATLRGETHFVSQLQPTSEPAETDQAEVAGDNARGARPNIVGEVPSISRFVPPGHKAVAIPWNRLYGAEHLQIGDVVDLTVSYSLQYEAASKEQERKPDGTVIERTIKRRASEPTQRTYEDTLGFRGDPSGVQPGFSADISAGSTV